MAYNWFPVLVNSVPDGDTFQGTVYKLDGFRIKYLREKTVGSSILSSSPSEITIRIMNIDAPETSQPFGSNSKTYLENLILGQIVWCKQFKDEILNLPELGRYLKVKTNLSRDRFGRQLCEVFLRNETFFYQAFDIQNLESSVVNLTNYYLSDANIKTIVDEDLVSKGIAWNYVQFTNKPSLALLQTIAEDSNLGLWGCNPASIMYPADYRKIRKTNPSFTLPSC
jgi:endonuclease YncB( thermonuclease family)